RLLDVDFGLRIADRVDHLEQRPCMELAVLGIDLDFELLTGIYTLQRRRLQRIRDRGNHVGATDALFLFHVFKDGKNFAAHNLRNLGKKKWARKAHFLEKWCLRVGKLTDWRFILSSPAAIGGGRCHQSPVFSRAAGPEIARRQKDKPTLLSHRQGTVFA